jgi:hypothetical protein
MGIFMDMKGKESKAVKGKHTTDEEKDGERKEEEVLKKG